MAATVRDADELKMFAWDNEDVYPSLVPCQARPALFSLTPYSPSELPNRRIAEARILPNRRIAEARILPDRRIARRVRRPHDSARADQPCISGGGAGGRTQVNGAIMAVLRGFDIAGRI